MSQLSFNCQFRSSELSQLGLPVEIRKENLSLVKRAVSSETVELAPGTYHITATLPAGQELYTQVNVREGEPAVAQLSVDLEDASPTGALEVQSYLMAKSVMPSADTNGLEALALNTVAAQLRGFEGNLLGDVVTPHATGWAFTPAPAPMPGMAKFVCAPGARRFVQLLQPGVTPLNVALPIAPDVSCHLYLTQQPGGIDMDLHLENLKADTMLRYYTQGLLDQASTAADPSFFEGLLAAKHDDPIAAVAGAYILLRLGELKRLHDWTQNLARFDWLPDGVVIWAEHQARMGQHAGALQTLLQLPSRGLPIFSDGISYAINRLRLYFGAKDAGLPADGVEQAGALLGKLQRFAAEVDFGKPILTFTGLDPNQPGDAPVSGDLSAFDGLDVAPFFG